MRKLFLLLLLLCPAIASAQAVRFDSTTNNIAGRPIGGANIAVCGYPGMATTAASVTSNTAVLTMASNPITAGYAAGTTLNILNFTGSDTYLNGTWTTTSVTSSTIVFIITHANATASSNGNVFQTGNSTTSCAPLATIYTDYTGSTPSSVNPFTSDGLGNFGWWGASSTLYAYQVYGGGITTTVKYWIGGGSGGGSGSPCTATALSFQYNNAGALGCVPDLIFTSPHTVTAGSSGIFDFSLANLFKFGALTSATANPAGAGALRLAKSDVINWRNNANSGNLSLGINGSDQLTFQGNTFCPVGSTTTQILFNFGGSCQGSNNFTWDNIGQQLAVTGNIYVGANGMPGWAYLCNSESPAQISPNVPTCYAALSDVSITMGTSDPNVSGVPYSGGYFIGSASGTGTLNTMVGVIGQAEIGGNSSVSLFGNVNNAIGVDGTTNIGPSGTTTEIDELQADAVVYDSGAPIQPLVNGLRVKDMGLYSPTLSHGIYIDSQSNGGYSFYSAGGPGYHAGNFKFGSTIQLAGSSSGLITIQTQAAAGTYNFNLPTTAGTSGTALLSGGGSTSPETWSGVNFANSTVAFPEISTPSGISSTDVMWGDSASHQVKVKLNNGSALFVPNTDGSGVGGHCAEFTSAYEIVDNGGACGSGGTGTVTAFTAPGSPCFVLFTCSVANGTTTPALTFTQSTFTAHKFFGNSTGSTANPAATLIGVSDTSPNAYAVDSGSVNAATVTLSPAATALTAGLEIDFLPTANNTSTTPTINASGLGSKTITKLGTAALATGDLTTTAIAKIIYDGTEFQLQNPQTATSGSGVTLQTNSVNNTTQTTLNFTNTSGASGINFTNPGTSVESAALASVAGGGNSVLQGTLTGPAAGDYICENNSVNLANCTPGVVINAQTGTSYTVLTSDRGGLITQSNSSASAYTLPQAGSTGFAGSFYFCLQNKGAGAATITPTTSTINGNSTLVLLNGQSACVNSDNSNYTARVTGYPSATTGTIGGAIVGVGCDTGTVTINGATTSMVPVAVATTSGAPGAGLTVGAQVTSANTVTVSVCAPLTLTPTSSTYLVRLLP